MSDKRKRWKYQNTSSSFLQQKTNFSCTRLGKTNNVWCALHVKLNFEGFFYFILNFTCFVCKGEKYLFRRGVVPWDRKKLHICKWFTYESFPHATQSHVNTFICLLFSHQASESECIQWLTFFHKKFTILHHLSQIS